MSIKRHIVRSCCGSKAFIFEANKPIRKNQIYIFERHNYTLPSNFKVAGVFYARRGNLVATSAYGSNRINVRCSGKGCIEQLDFFEKTLDKAVNS